MSRLQWANKGGVICPDGICYLQILEYNTSLSLFSSKCLTLTFELRKAQAILAAGQEGLKNWWWSDTPGLYLPGAKFENDENRLKYLSQRFS